jgi:hypothetical protein
LPEGEGLPYTARVRPQIKAPPIGNFGPAAKDS